MPRLMSFSMTVDAMRERRKTVTRRLGWFELKPGIRVVSVRLEALYSIAEQGRDEVRREGFEMEPSDFVAMFCAANGCKPWHVVSRIEFEHVT